MFKKDKSQEAGAVRIKQKKMPMSPAKKLLLVILLAVLVIFALYMVYYLVHYVSYDRYRDFLSDYSIEGGVSYTALTDSSPSVEGYELVAENDNLKLYTDTKTANIAVFDKRNGQVTYSNPQDPDNDSVANRANKAYLKSQMLVYYYNKDVVSGT